MKEHMNAFLSSKTLLNDSLVVREEMRFERALAKVNANGRDSL